MGWFQVAAAVFAFAKEVIKYLREEGKTSAECKEVLEGAKNAIILARKSKDTSKIEHSFAALGITKPNSSDK